MGIGDLSGSYQRLSTWGDKSDKAGAADSSRGPGKFHKAGSGEFRAAIGEIATKTLLALQSAFAKINFSQHVDTLKQLSHTLSQVKTLVLQKIFPKDLLSSMSLGRASSPSKVNKLMEQLAGSRSDSTAGHWSSDKSARAGQGENPVNLMDRDMHPIVADLLGSAEELEGDNTKMQSFNELWESLPSSPRAGESSNGPHLMDQEMQPIDLKSRARGKSDEAVQKMTSDIDRDLLASLRKDVEARPRTELQERAASLKFLSPGELKAAQQQTTQRVSERRASKSEAAEETARGQLRQAASGLKLLTPEEMRVVKKEIGERNKQAQKIKFTINSTTQVLDRAAELGLVDKNQAATLIKNLSFAGDIAAKGSAESMKVEQSLDAFTIKAHKGLEV